MQNRPDEALREADLAAAADPTLPTPLLVQGMIEYNTERFAEALPFLLKAREAYAHRTLQARDLNFYIADSLARLERYKEAEPYFLQELRLHPQNTRARAGLALLYESMGRAEEAERVIQEMLQVSPNPTAYDRAAYLYRLFGQAGSRCARDSRRGEGETLTGRNDGARRVARGVDALIALVGVGAAWRSCGGSAGAGVRASRRGPIATSCSSRSTRCARTRSDRTAAAPRRRTSIGSPRRGARFTFAHAHAGADPAVAHVDPDRSVPLRARRARQQRLPRPRRRGRRWRRD